MHPADHCKTSAKIWGGKPEDYLHLHQWMDDTKQTFCDFRHRALRHHSYGIFEAEKVFGVSFTNSAGKEVHVRYVLEQHVKEDCGGRIPTVEDWLKGMKPEVWMSRGYKVSGESK
jgi:hypothetical protein